MKKLLASITCAAALICGVSFQADAAYPEKSIQIIVPWAPGGGSDISARIVADGLKKHLPQPVVVTNVTGASGLNGAQKVFEARPDGYTVLWEHAANLAVTPAIGKAKYSWKDFEMLGSIGHSPLGVFCKKDAKWNTLAEAIAEIKANPGKIGWAAAPNAASGFCCYAIQEATGGFEPMIINAPGDKGRIVSVLGGTTSISAAALASLVPYVKSGDIKLFATCSADRDPGAPDTPTLKEQGIDVIFEYMYSIEMPKGTPADVQKTFADAVAKTIADPEVIKKLNEQGITVKWRNSEETSKIWEGESSRDLRLAKAHGLIK